MDGDRTQVRCEAMRGRIYPWLVQAELTDLSAIISARRVVFEASPCTLVGDLLILCN